jgi:hypothetical protein
VVYMGNDGDIAYRLGHRGTFFLLVGFGLGGYGVGGREKANRRAVRLFPFYQQGFWSHCGAFRHTIPAFNRLK